MNSQKRSNFKSTRYSLPNEMVNFYYLDNKKEVRNLDTLYRNGITRGRHEVVQKGQNTEWLGKGIRPRAILTIVKNGLEK